MELEELRLKAREFEGRKEKYLAVLEQSKDNIFLLDLETRSILEANRALRELLGYTDDEMTRLTVYDFIVAPPEDVDQKIAEVVERGSIFLSHRKYRSRQGRLVDVEVSANLIAYSGKQALCIVSRDIGQRLQTEKVLAASEEKYKSLIQASNDGMYLLYNRKFEVINPKFEEMFEVTLEDVNRPDFDFIELVASRSRPLIEERNQKMLRGESLDSKYEFTAISKSGKEIDVEASVSYIKYKDGIAVQGVIRDITERKRLEQHLIQAQKMEALGTLAGGIAHDFNNILGAIIGYAELSLYEVPSEDPIHRNLGRILDASERARELIKQILAFSRRSQYKRKPLRVSQVASEALRLLRSILPANVVVRYEAEKNNSLALADPVQIHQVMMNLASNAADAMQERGGVLTFSLRDVSIVNRPPGKEDFKPGPYVELTVSDTGHGMTPEVMKRIFEPYFTTKELGRGTGMGLAVVHGIVKSYNGDISVYSEPGEGSVFKILLPRVGKAEAADSRPKITIIGGDERILFVDDEKDLVTVGKKILEQLGYTVVSSTSSLDALDEFRAAPGQFDLVITDQTMPYMTGVQLAENLQKVRPNIPIILCTGFSQTVARERCLELGIKEFVLKPINRQHLAQAIRRALSA
jgi:PAS domain S-box-containing protein